nr:glycosyltransferase family 2 protein [Compostimonas suwonensis]
MLNWRDSMRTIRCLTSLLRSEDIEHVYVVDNESTGELDALLRDLPLDGRRWSLRPFSENRGFAAGVNPALRESLREGFDACLVINNDASIEPRAVAQLVRELSSSAELALVAPRIIGSDGIPESAGGYLRPAWGMTTHAARDGAEPDFVTWACVLVKADALRQVGLLSEKFFMYWEDVDYSVRLRAAGRLFSVSAIASATHETSSNRRVYPTAIKAYHTWAALVFARSQGGRWRLGGLVWIAVSALSNLVRFRGGTLRGLWLGIRLARERADPAFTSPLRSSAFE